MDFDGFSTRKINTNLPCCAKIHTGCTWLDTWCRSAPTPILCPGCINLSSFANATDSGWICIQSHIHTHIYIYTQYHGYTHTHIYIHTVSRICSAVSLRWQEHTCCPYSIAPVCVLWPQNKGKILDPKMWSQCINISSPASKFAAPISGACALQPLCLLQRVRWAATACIFHSCFLCWCQDGGSTCRERRKEWQKACKPTAPKMGLRRSANEKNLSKGVGMPVLFCSKHAKLNLDSHKQCKDICTTSGSVQDPGGNPRHPQTSKLTYFRLSAKQLHSPGKQQDWLLWVATLIPGERGQVCVHISTYGSSFKFAIRIGLAAKLY